MKNKDRNSGAKQRAHYTMINRTHVQQPTWRLLYHVGVRGINFHRWGEAIYDPDVSSVCYYERRRADKTLPFFDPRDSKWANYWELTPYEKWLYFSDELGSYERRKEFFNLNDGSKERLALEKRLNPNLLPVEFHAKLHPQVNLGVGRRHSRYLYDSHWDTMDEYRRLNVYAFFIITILVSFLLHYLGIVDLGD
jgi:hypothetical protein